VLLCRFDDGELSMSREHAMVGRGQERERSNTLIGCIHLYNLTKIWFLRIKLSVVVVDSSFAWSFLSESSKNLVFMVVGLYFPYSRFEFGMYHGHPG